MSPEQMTPGSTIDARSDIWALGIVLTELCTGQLPFDADSLARLFGLLMNGKPRLPSELAANMPLALDAIVQRCLEKDPAARFASVAELALALAELLPQASETGHRNSGWQRAHAARFTTSAGLSAPANGASETGSTSVRASTVATGRPWARWGALATLSLTAVAWFASRSHTGIQDAASVSASSISAAAPIVIATPLVVAPGPVAPPATPRIDVIPTPTVSRAASGGVTAPLGTASASRPKARPRKTDAVSSAAAASRTAPTPWNIESFGGRR
jgi:serine/threonine-protein kinase